MNNEIHNNIEETENLLNSINTSDSIQFSEWTKEKANLRYYGQLPKFPIYNNFIYWCNLGINIGSEQNKLRPVLVLRTSKNSPICTVLPLTTKRLQDGFLFHIDLEEVDSTVLVEQLKVVSKIRITNPYRKKGNLVVISSNDWNKINSQLESLYRLRPLKKE
jgi:mRNA-degrading endonuclease toxin of MazEF toxin-antitoxin module